MDPPFQRPELPELSWLLYQAPYPELLVTSHYLDEGHKLGLDAERYIHSWWNRGYMTSKMDEGKHPSWE